MKKVSRRSFLEKSSMVLASAAAITAIPASAQAAQAPSMFVHHVYFWLKNPSSKPDHAKLLKGLQSLTSIEAIKTSHIGVPADTNRPVIEKSYQFSLLLIFNNRQDQDTYQTHPTHLKFVEDCSNLWTKVIVYDSVNA
ncbi:Dabb family protein [Rhodocytophaga rosea]|uniref:Dabb family protein n=1 Tax=Rhodocytophaga rosea TaxID=2704465 RepID=A0A6C0GDV5_9BACT|nr:Dabb family protein [Rhodocytophaga rosea]QHT66146.1 Dabb family protein [Rhodocytophaga rosea]